MAERKIFNFESKILKDRTIEVYGYDPDTLGRCSRLYVMATCRYCGKEMRILKGNFNKIGSACHKECRMETQKKQDSPFNNPETRAKANNKITELYGKNREEIGRRISKTKQMKNGKISEEQNILNSNIENEQKNIKNNSQFSSLGAKERPTQKPKRERKFSPNLRTEKVRERKEEQI